MKKAITTLGILVLAGVLAAPVFAHRSGGGGGMHGGDYGDCRYEGGRAGKITDEQREAIDNLEEEFYADTSKLRNELFGKTDELEILLRSSDPDPAKAKAIQKEISELKAKLAEKRIDFELKARKIAPEYIGRGYGRHMLGGRGQHMGGRGPGACLE